MIVERELERLNGLTALKQCRVLSRLAADVRKGQVILEIGVYKGRTACWLAAGAMAGNDAHVYGVDPWDLPGQDAYDDLPAKRRRFTAAGNHQRANAAVYRCGLADRVTFLQGFSVDVARYQWHETRPIGLLYVDGNHTGPAPYDDFVAWSTHLAADAVVAWDDYDATRFPDVVAAVDLLVAEGHLALTRVTGPLAITRRQA